MATYRLLNALICIVLSSAGAWSQTLQLFESNTGAAEVEAQIGDVIEIEVMANLGRFAASGVALYVSVPHAFQIVDTHPDDANDMRPFHQGALFAGATEAGNVLLSAEETQGMENDKYMLSYAAVVGPGEDRARTGQGVVACFKVLCLEATEQAPIGITSNPILETRLVLADGWTEQRFTVVKGLDISVQDQDTSVEPDQSWGRIKADFTRAD